MKINIKNSLSYKIILILALWLLLFISLSSVNAETNITSSDNLGQTISEASNNETINLANGTYTNNVTNITINKNLTIQGEGSDTIINGNNIFGGIFKITIGNSLTLKNIRIINGNGVQGGAIFNNGGSITIENCIFENNYANTEGGAIFNNNTKDVNIVNCIFNNNNGNNFGGAISNINVNNVYILNCDFTNNIADFAAAIAADKGNNTNIINCNFTDNIAGFDFIQGNIRGAVIDLALNNSVIQGCDISNNNQGRSNCAAIIIESSSNNFTINYNRFFHNTGYDIRIMGGTNINIDYNWWGSNNLDMTKIIGSVIPKNYFIMDITNITPLDSNGSVTFKYTLKLNSSEIADNSLLPYFLTYAYNNITSEVVEFEAKLDKTFNIVVNIEGDILYTFITDDEIQTLEGTIIIPLKPPEPPQPPIITPKPNPNPEPTLETPVNPTLIPIPDPNIPNQEQDKINETSNNPVANATMKNTGMPIAILLIIILLSLITSRRKN